MYFRTLFSETVAGAIPLRAARGVGVWAHSIEAAIRKMAATDTVRFVCISMMADRLSGSLSQGRRR